MRSAHRCKPLILFSFLPSGTPFASAAWLLAQLADNVKEKMLASPKKKLN